MAGTRPISLTIPGLKLPTIYVESIYYVPGALDEQTKPHLALPQRLHAGVTLRQLLLELLYSKLGTVVRHHPARSRSSSCTIPA